MWRSLSLSHHLHPQRTLKLLHRSLSFTQSSIFLQEGHQILESPLLIKLTTDLTRLPQSPITSSPLSKPPEDPPSDLIIKINGVNFMDQSSSPKTSSTNQKRIEINTEDGTAILFAPSSPASPPPPLCRLEDVPVDVKCRVYLQILHRILQSENTMISNDWSVPMYEQYRSTRNELLQDVVETIASINDNDLIIEALNLLAKDRISPQKNTYRNRLVNELLLRSCNHDFSINQIIRIIKALSNYHDRWYREAIDLLWTGIKEREDEITPVNYIDLIKTLDFFGESQEIVKMICIKKLKEVHRQLDGGDMSEVVRIFQESLESSEVDEYVDDWCYERIKFFKEINEVIEFLRSLKARGRYSKRLEEGIEEFCTDKIEEIKDPEVIACLMSFCETLRIRNVKILNCCAEFLRKYGDDVPDNLLAQIFVPFGYLNYRVPDKEFWENFEELLGKKIGRLGLNDGVDVLLSCAYLQKFSEKLAGKVFRLRFTRRRSREKLREKLVLLDRAMAFEFSKEEQFADKIGSSVATRPKLRRVMDLIYPELLKISGENRLSRAVMFGEFLHDNEYIVDAVIHGNMVESSVFRVGDNGDVKTAVLIHLPEDYCRNSEVLIGPKGMRIRHLRKLGLRVMLLDYMMLLKHSGEAEMMAQYLREKFENAEMPLV